MTTEIEWADETWNFIVGCKIVSPGCKNCYAMKDAWRLAHNPLTPQYIGTVELVNGKAVWTGFVRFVEHQLDEPLHWRKPRKVFVNSMGDLFYEAIPDEWIDRGFDVMERCPQHIFQILTKRPQRMRDYVRRRYAGKTARAFLAGHVGRTADRGRRACPVAAAGPSRGALHLGRTAARTDRSQRVDRRAELDHRRR